MESDIEQRKRRQSVQKMGGVVANSTQGQGGPRGKKAQGEERASRTGYLPPPEETLIDKRTREIEGGGYQKSENHSRH